MSGSQHRSRTPKKSQAPKARRNLTPPAPPRKDTTGMMRRALTASVFFSFGCGLAFLWAKRRSTKELEAERVDKSRLGMTPYDDLAETYDSLLSQDEVRFGILKQRARLMALATGSVLEVSCGTGRNFKYLPDTIRDLVATDCSQSMVDVAETKGKSLKFQFPAQYQVMDGSQLSFPDDSFDTVVQTYGICSHEHPEDTLKEMARVCKPTGKILLLEHGRSKWRLVNWYLDRNREQHEEKWGCTWNKDINQILHDSGLELEETRVNLLGTNFYYVAHPAREE